MKIILVSQVPNFFESYRKENQPFAPFQAQTFWLRALNRLGHDVVVFRYSDAIGIPQRLNIKLTQSFQTSFPRIYRKYRLLKNKYPWVFGDNHVKSLQLAWILWVKRPQVILMSGGISELVGYSLWMARLLNIPVVLLHGVNPQIGATGYERLFIKYFSLIVTNDHNHARLWKKMGVKQAICLPYSGIDPAYHRPLSQKKDIQILFVGTLFPDRIRFLDQLLDKFSLPIKVYGYIPDQAQLTPTVKKVYCGEAWGKSLIQLYSRSQIVLNLLPDHMPEGANLRLFEIPACQALQIASSCDPNWFIHDKEIVVFHSTADLISKIKYYLTHKTARERISLKGYERTLSQYTYDQRFESILDTKSLRLTSKS